MGELLSEVAPTGNRLTTLETLRDKLADTIDKCDSLRDLAALTNRFQSVLAEIDELRPPEKKGDVVDQIAERRNARRGGASTGQGRAERTSKLVGGRL